MELAYHGHQDTQDTIKKVTHNKSFCLSCFLRFFISVTELYHGISDENIMTATSLTTVTHEAFHYFVSPG